MRGDATYLYLSCRFLGLNNNDAFSGLQLDSFRGFLRMRIKDDELQVFPIGLDEVPNRAGWTLNPEPSDSNRALYLPADSLKLRLCEGPVIIDTSRIRQVASVAQPTKPPQ
jgi:hypothetical protein